MIRVTASSAAKPAGSRRLGPLRALPDVRALRAGVVAAGVALLTGAAAAQVGFTQMQLNGLPVTLVYPTDVKATKQTFGAFEIEVAVDAPPAPVATSAGRRRLIVTSHGTAGSPLPDHGLAAALARAGFVVAQPLHSGDNWRDATKAGPEAWRSRPTEVLQVIDALAAHPLWGAQLQLDRVGVHGTSAGGVTGLSLAGAQWSTFSLLQHCNAHLEADSGFCLTGAPDAAAQAKRRAMYERVRGVPVAFLPSEVTAWQGGRSLATSSVSPAPPASTTPPASAPGDGTPAGRWPQSASAFDPRPDARIASVSLSVPVAAIFSAESLARIRVPVGLLTAQADEWLLPAFHSGHVARQCRNCTVLADLPGATHFDVMHPWPGAAAAEVARTQPRGAAANPAFDGRLRDEAYARVVQFHRQNLGTP
jgi:predicted dienelactone hydrolase